MDTEFPIVPLQFMLAIGKKNSGCVQLEVALPTLLDELFGRYCAEIVQVPFQRVADPSKSGGVVAMGASGWFADDLGGDAKFVE